MTTLRDPFAVTHKKDIKNKRGETVAQVDYIGWSQTADRLDEAEEVASWSFAIIGLGEDWAHGRLTLTNADGSTRHFENIGYAENADQEWKKEPLKDAVSDAFKRCAAMPGVGRYLYDKDSPRNGAPARQERPQTPAPAPVRARPHIVDTDLTAPDDEDNPFDDPLDTTPVLRPEETRCPWHPNREPKQGRYGLFCSGQGGNGPLNAKGYCDYKFTGAA